jgi:transposase
VSGVDGKLKAEGLGATEIAKRLNIGRASFYRVSGRSSDIGLLPKDLIFTVAGFG